MKTISKRDLNQQTAQVLAAIDAGESVLVTERGIARWRIEVVDASADPVARLRATGRIAPAKTNPAAWPVTKARYTPAEVDTLFSGSRGDY